MSSGGQQLSGISYGKMVLFTTGAKVLAWGINAGGRGAAILSPVGPVLDPSGRIIFAPAANQFGSPLANFDFKANDGQMDSPPASVAINIVLPPAPQLNAAKSGSTAIAPPNLTVGGPSVAGSGGFSLRFAGHSNLIYSVWASTNLLHWLPEGTASPITNGWLQFVDTDSPNWPLRFYRISIPNTRAYELNFSGHSNASYRVWASTNLVDWEVLGIATVTSNGWFNFLDVDAAKWPKRFYRAGAP